MFNSIKRTLTPINVSRKGQKRYRQPGINIYKHENLLDFFATDYGTYTPTTSESLTYTGNILNHTGIATFYEQSSASYAWLNFQLGIDWAKTDLFPGTYQNYVLTIERKTFDQGRNVDIAVSNNLAYGSNTDSNNPWEPFDVRDGADTTGNNQYIQGFTNLDLITKGFLFYCVLRYPTNWTPASNDYGFYGTNAFDTIDKSFIWIIDDNLLEDPEEFYIRIRALPDTQGFNPQNILQQGSNTFYDFLDDFSQRELENADIISETLFKITGPTRSQISISGIVTSPYTSETSGIIGFGPNFINGNTGEESFDVGSSGNIGWDYPQMVWAPISQTKSIGTQLLDDPIPQVNLPVGPFCGAYTSSAFFSVYKKEELEAAGLSTGCSVKNMIMDLVRTQSSSYYPVNGYIHILHLDTSADNDVITSASFDDLKLRMRTKWANNRVEPGQYYTWYDRMHGSIGWDYTFNPDVRYNVGWKEFSNTSSAYLRFLWNGKDDIAICWEYDYLQGYVNSEDAYDPSNIAADGTVRTTSVGKDVALFRMNKTYVQDPSSTGIMGGSFAYLYPNKLSGNTTFTNTLSVNSFSSADETATGEMYAKYDSTQSSTLGSGAVNLGLLTYGDVVGSNKFAVFARPLIQLEWDKVTYYTSKLFFDYRVTYGASLGDTTYKFYLQPGGQNSSSYTSTLLGPLPITYHDSSGTYTSTSLTSANHSGHGSFYRAEVDLSNGGQYVAIGACHVVIVGEKSTQTTGTMLIHLGNMTITTPLDTSGNEIWKAVSGPNVGTGNTGWIFDADPTSPHYASVWLTSSDYNMTQFQYRELAPSCWVYDEITIPTEPVFWYYLSDGVTKRNRYVNSGFATVTNSSSWIFDSGRIVLRTQGDNSTNGWTTNKRSYLQTWRTFYV